MFHALVSTLTATGDTTKTLIDTITVPFGAKKIIGVWSQAIGGATLTSGECASGILELESADIALQPMQFPLDIADILTSGALSLKPTIIPTDISVNGGERIAGYMTMDMAQTGALKGRFGLILE